MLRRSIISIASGVGAAMLVTAQTAPKVYRVGVLWSGGSAPTRLVMIPAALRALDYEEQRNIVFEHRYANGKYDEAPGLAADLVARTVAIILALENPDVAAAKAATSSIPIVMMYSSTPVENGYVASLARPGGNLTGTAVQVEIFAKQLQVLRTTLPTARRLTLLWNSKWVGDGNISDATRVAAALGFQLTMLAVNKLEELELAFARLQQDRAEALYVMWPLDPQGSARDIEFAARQPLPAMYTNTSFVRLGGLMG